MCKKIVFFLITWICFAVSTDAANKFTLVIDAGHGGHDTGACGAISKEKNLTLKFALAFGQLVERNCPDVRVIYTRKTDRFIELYRRAEIANKYKADLFISIHINALPKGHIARGFQTYTLGTSKRTGKRTGVFENLEVAKRENAVIYLEKDYKQTYHGYDPNSPESNIMFEFIQDKNMENSVELAKYMQRYVCQATGRQDQGAQQDNLAVLRLTSMPGCLIELGFISTRDEEQYMNSAKATEQYARGIYNAFAAYKKKHSGSITVPYLPEPETEKKVELPQIVPASAKEEAKKPDTTPKPVPVQESAPVQGSVPAQESAVAPQTTEGAEQVSIVEEIPNVDLSVVPETAPVPVETPKSVENRPIFKIQILTSSSRLKAGDSRFKGLTAIDSYTEGGLVKYTTGASADYNEIYRLRKSILDKFPEAFIIAFKNGSKMNVQEAIREFKQQKR